MIDIQCKEIIRRLKIRTFVETGTDMAETVAQVSRWFAEWDPEFGRIASSVKAEGRAYNSWNEGFTYPQFDDVRDSKFKIHSVDADQYVYETASRNFSSNENITFHHESSEVFLRGFVQDRLDSSSSDYVFFFLDAHWGKYWPLQDELRGIARLERFVICIDDVFVPEKSNRAKPHGDFGYDLYRGTILDWAYIRTALQGVNISMRYSGTSNRDRRGWLLIFAGDFEQELSGMDWSEFIEYDVDDPRHTVPVKPHPFAHLDFRNLVKRAIPLRILRALVRVYQRIT